MRNYKLHLIRHGLTQGNLEGRYLGCGTDSPLCEKGKERLEYLKQTFEYPKPEKIYVSPMTRAIETTQIIFPDQEYTIVSDLRECHFGEFEGKTFSELMDSDPAFATWLDPKSGYQPQGGESSADFAQRCVTVLDEILTDMMKNGIFEGAAVCHGGLIGMLLTLVAFPRKPVSEWTSDNGCGFTIQVDPALWMRDKAVEVVALQPAGYDFSESQHNKFRKKED